MAYKEKKVGSELVKKKRKTNEMHYPLDKIYFAEVEGDECIVCETYLNHKPKFVEVITLPNYKIIDRTLNNNFTIKESLKEVIDNKKMNVCLLTKDGSEKRDLTIDNIINIIKFIKLVEKTSFDKLDNVCLNASNVICDLLGINIYSNPNSSLRLKDVEQIVVPATKVEKFKNLLLNYIKISIILDGNATISNNDYRIIRALKGCKIKNSEFENEFTITITCNGIEKLECLNIEQSFQKRFKKSKKQIA